MRVEFTRDFDWSPPEKRGRIHIAFKRGMRLTVRRICAEAAIAAGAAKPLTHKEPDDAAQCR